MTREKGRSETQPVENRWFQRDGFALYTGFRQSNSWELGTVSTRLNKLVLMKQETPLFLTERC